MVEWLQRDKQHALQIEETGILKYRSIRWGIYILLALFTLVLQVHKRNSFIFNSKVMKKFYKQYPPNSRNPYHLNTGNNNASYGTRRVFTSL